MSRKKERKPTKIEDQALTVYHFWYVWTGSPRPDLRERFDGYLLGLFDLLKQELPEAAEEARQDAVDRLKRIQEGRE